VNGGKFLDWLSVLSFRQKDCSMELVISLVVRPVLCKLLRIVVQLGDQELATARNA
jgi:hypothetical protein